ncbi:MAG: hypothetical protein ACYDCJ_05080 [Gammaproteobacteria bacterium]
MTTSQSVARDAIGNFVVVWAGTPPSGNYAVFAQYYNAEGTAQGGIIPVSSNPTLDQVDPAVNMDATGDFVVAWEGKSTNGSYSLFAQRYNAGGTAQGGAITVSTNPGLTPVAPSVGMDAAGDFVIAWQGMPSASSNYAIFAQFYTRTGTAQGPVIAVSNDPTEIQSVPSVGMDAAGDFVVAWEGNTANHPGIFAQAYTASGTANGSTITVSLNPSFGRYLPSISLDAAGDFVVAWEETFDASGFFAISAQLYNASGIAQGGALSVSNNPAQNELAPAVSLDANGDFVVAWAGGGPITPTAIFARRYNSGGTPQGLVIPVSNLAPLIESNPAVGMDANGDFVVAWGQTQSSPYNIYAQRYEGPEEIDLSGSLTASPATVTAGGSVSLTYALSNLSAAGTVANPIINAVINQAYAGAQTSFTLPAGMVFTTASGTSWNCPTAPTNGVLTCSYNTGIPAASVAESLALTLKAPGTAGVLTVSSVTTGVQPDPNAGNNSASAVVTVQGSSGGGGGGGSGGGGGGGGLGPLNLLLLAALLRRKRFSCREHVPT